MIFYTVLSSWSSNKTNTPRSREQVVAKMGGRKQLYIIIWPVRPCAQFPWKTLREKVPYEGRTRGSDRAGKTRTALLETSAAKSMRANDKNNFVAAKVCSLQNELWKSTFWEQILLSRQIVPCRTISLLHQLPTHSKSKERNLTILANWMKKLTTFSEANKQTGGQGNNLSR